jgi:HSP20 family protein
MANVTNRSAGEIFHPLFENFFSEPLGGRHLGALMRAPEADVIELENEIRVMVEMPGMRADDIELGLENNVLSISGEKRQESERGDRTTWHLSERRYGQFSRSFLLPRDVEHDRIEAGFSDGVLTVRIPKSEKARRRRIQIRSESGPQRVEAGGVEVGGDGNGDSRNR